MAKNDKSPFEKAKDLAMVVAIVMSGVTGKVTWSNHELTVEIEKTQKQLAAAQEQANGFALAGVCD